MSLESKINGGVAVIEKKGQHLLIKQPKNKQFSGQWRLPGGRLEKGETITDCLKREMKEELNLELKDINPNPLFIARSYHGPNFGFFKVSVKNFDNIKIDKKEAAAFGWFTVEEIKKLDLMEATKEFYKRFKK